MAPNDFSVFLLSCEVKGQNCMSALQQIRAGRRSYAKTYRQVERDDVGPGEHVLQTGAVLVLGSGSSLLDRVPVVIQDLHVPAEVPEREGGRTSRVSARRELASSVAA